MEWKQNYFSRPSVVAANTLHTFIHILGVIQQNCLPDVRSYTMLFANWQIVDTYTLICYHYQFTVYHFPKLSMNPVTFNLQVSNFGNFLISFHESTLYI